MDQSKRTTSTKEPESKKHVEAHIYAVFVKKTTTRCCKCVANISNYMPY